MEIWKDIPELNGKYQCSNYGRVRRINKDPRVEKYKILKLQLTNKGYMSVNPTKDYRKSVHRIVGELFLERQDGKNIINHKDLDKTNNRFDNLEWVSYSENSKHAQDNGKLGRLHVNVIDINTSRTFGSIKDASEYFGYPYTYMAKILKQKGQYKNILIVEKTYKNIP